MPSGSSRLAVPPLPPILPSLNQIGFDSYDTVVGVLRAGAAGCCSGRSAPRATSSTARAPSRSAPGRVPRRLAAALPARSSLTFSFGDVPLQRFDLRAALDADLRPRRQPDRRGVLPRRSRLRPGAGRHRAVQAATPSCPRAGPSSPAPTAARPTSARAAFAWRASSWTVTRTVVAQLAGTPLQADRHAAAILLTDASSEAVVSLDYRKRTSVSCAVAPSREVRLRIPRVHDSSRTHQGLRDYRCLPAGEREL